MKIRISPFYPKHLSLKTLIFIALATFHWVSDAFSNRPNVVNFYKNQYQAANKNWSISQDSLGTMYFGNDKGLLEFDGIRWKLYTIPKAKIVRAVAVSSQNLVFTGGYEEFGMWKRDISGELIYTSLSKNLKRGIDGLHNDDIWKIRVTDSLVYFQSFSHIYIYDYQKIKTVNTKGAGVLFLLQVGDEFFVQKMAGSLCRLIDGQLEEIPGSDFLKKTEVRLILPYPGKRYLIGTSSAGFFIFDGKTFSPWNSEFSQLVTSSQLNSGILLKNGHYFFGTLLDGLYEVSQNGQVINHFTTDNSLQNNTVLSLYEDRNNNVWVALDHGISYIQYLREMDCYVDHFGKIGAVYSAAFFDDKLFLGTNQGVFYLPKNQLISSQALTNFKILEGIQGQVWNLTVVENRLLCGFNNGLAVIDKNLHVSHYKLPGVYTIKPVNYSGRDALFLGTYTAAIALSPEFNRLSNFKSIREPIRSIQIDHLGNIWMEHVEKGVYRCRFSGSIDNAELNKAYGGGENDGLPFNLRLFKFGSKVIFYGDDTFYVYNDLEDKIVEYKELNNCFEGITDVRNMVALSDNLFFAITGSCIYKVYYDGYHVRIVDRFDIGYNNMSMVNMYENALALDDSLSLICLDNGFLLHNTNSKTLLNNAIIKAPAIRSIKTFNSKSKIAYVAFSEKNTNISYSQNTVLFDFFSENVLANNLSFQYQLKGVSTDWSQPAKINEILFERLPKGEYDFMVRTTDNLGNYSEPTDFHFTILPPWYANSWAYVGYFLLFIIIMITVWFIILRKYRNAHLLKVRMREERRLRNQNMHLKKEIEEKNEELFAQTSFIIQKNELILKIKKEFDDLYNNYSGNKIIRPLYDKISALLNRNMDIEEDWKMFLIQFEQKHTDFFKRMKDLHPKLTSNDLKFCACLKLNLSSKDIAALMNMSIRGVENGRYRLRKKLDLPQNQNLNEYFMQF